MHYRILPGHSFRDSDNSVKTGGDTIELSDDVAQANAEKIEPITTVGVDIQRDGALGSGGDHAE